MRIRCTEELHDHGGPGRFLLARAEDALDGLLAEYEGRATLIYLDPPSGAGDTFHLCLGRGQKPLALPCPTTGWTRRPASPGCALCSPAAAACSRRTAACTCTPTAA